MGAPTATGATELMMIWFLPKADFHLTSVRAGVAPKSEHVLWSRFCVHCESQKVDRVSTHCQGHLISTTHAHIWVYACAQKMSNGNRPLKIQRSSSYGNSTFSDRVFSRPRRRPRK